MTAYGNWWMRVKKSDTILHMTIKHISKPIEASVALQDDIGALIQLVHALPYPEVHVATLAEQVLVRAGQAAGSVAHAQMLHRIREQLAHKSQDLCTTWIDALIAPTTTADMAWSLTHVTERWERLQRAADQAHLDLPHRHRHGLADNLWCKLVAYLLIVPGCLPWAFTERPVPQRCDALIDWLAMEEHTRVAQDAAEAVNDRRWLEARRVSPSYDLDSESGGGPTPSSQSDTVRTEAPTRY